MAESRYCLKRILWATDSSYFDSSEERATMLFLDSILRGKYRAASSRQPSQGGRNRGGRRRAGRKSRQLRLEPLEIRSLLSGVPGLSSVAAAAQSQYESRGYYSYSTAQQLVLQQLDAAEVGVPVEMELVAANGHRSVVTNFSDSVSVTSGTDKTAKVSPITFQGGVAYFSVTFDTAGEQTLTATDTTTTTVPAVTAAVNVVNPAIATQLSLSTQGPAQTGVPVTMTLTAYNALNQPVTTFADNVTVTGTNVTVSAVTYDDGVGTFTVTFGTAGYQTLTLTDSTDPALSGTYFLRVRQGTTTPTPPAPSPATHLALSVVGSPVVNKPVTVELTALNAQGGTVTGFSDSVTVASSSDPTATVSPITFSNGVATFTVTFDKSGSQTLTATDTATGTSIPAVTVSTTVSPAPTTPSPATHLSLSVVGSPVVNEPVTVELTALNAQGGTVTGFSDSVTVASSSDPTATVSPITFSNGVATFTVTFDKSGSQTLTATDTANGTTIPAVTATTTVSPASTTTTPSPATNATTSSNWSGYAAQTSLNSPAANSVSAVYGTWTVPTVSGSGTAYSAVWVGIDGYSSSSVEQLGTEQDTVGGQAQYSAWYEMYPADSVTISTMTIHPGDTMTASVVYDTATSKYPSGYFVLSMTDTTTKQSFSIDEGNSGYQRSSAEWVVEAPSSNSGVLPLADFTPVTFTNATATIDGVTGAIDNSTWQNTAINMGTQSVAEDSTSTLTDSGGASSFTETYLTSASTSPGGHHHGFATEDNSPKLFQPSLHSSAAASSAFASVANHKTDNAVRDQVFASLDLCTAKPYGGTKSP